MFFLFLINLLMSQAEKKLPLELKKDANLSGQVVMEVIMDASGSMMQKIGKDYKIIAAKNTMKSFLLSNSNIDTLDLAFRVYGAETGTCEDSKIILGFEAMNTKDIVSEVSSLNPKPLAKTPLAKSLELASSDIKTRKGNKVIFLVTDGEETCGGDPCAVAKQLLKDFNIKIEVIGFAIKGAEAEKQLNCIATAGAAAIVDDPQGLNDAINNINNKYADKNLKVKSIDDKDTVSIYSVTSDKGSKKRLFRTFQAGIDQTIPPTGKNEKYEVVVMVEPKYVFEPFILNKFERKVLVVEGTGEFKADSVSGLIEFSLQDTNGKELKKLKSGEKQKINAGKYKLGFTYPPYVANELIEFAVYPNSKIDLSSSTVGALYVRTKKEVGQAYYILDAEGKSEIGTYITERAAILKVGFYKIRIYDDKIFDIEISPNEISFLSID